ILDSFCMMFVAPKIIMLANDHIKFNPLVGTIFRWSNFMTVGEGSANIVERLRPMVREGFCVAVFPEGERPSPTDYDVKRFHKGSFHIAEELGRDIVPVNFDGIRQIMPKGSALSNGGTIYIEIGERITREQLRGIGDTLAQAKELRRRYRTELGRIHACLSTPARLRPIVLDRYLYKGSDVVRHARKALRAFEAQADMIKEACAHDGTITVIDRLGQGELALMLALMYPSRQIVCRLGIAENRELLRGCIKDFSDNVDILPDEDDSEPNTGIIFRVLSKGEVCAQAPTTGFKTVKSYL
ncbi:MAG: 1-acyl-sn-glycerol-3-phosphate acyltransferase, partial [Muribaculaceae bacterium]|nr:1-acyl-sn-glycerol-3-phosphate acyltransferase [Muribaculaceae bacterium]